MKKFFSQKRVYYSIGEVSEKAAVNPYVLRFWEEKFSFFLRPKKDKSGRRRYTPDDLDVVLVIVDLLYSRKYTIEGAIQELETRFSTKARVAKLSSAQKTKLVIKEVRKSLRELRAELKKSGFYSVSETREDGKIVKIRELDSVQLNLFSDDIP
ncbi:MerR family transcriptional regulator [candidate division WOR-3 bacterium]|nr:MerR family transcriptional regulator [candidate division WOR-3 bacterium]